MPYGKEILRKEKFVVSHTFVWWNFTATRIDCASRYAWFYFLLLSAWCSLLQLVAYPDLCKLYDSLLFNRQRNFGYCISTNWKVLVQCCLCRGVCVYCWIVPVNCPKFWTERLRYLGKTATVISPYIVHLVSVHILQVKCPSINWWLKVQFWCCLFSFVNCCHHVAISKYCQYKFWIYCRVLSIVWLH